MSGPDSMAPDLSALVSAKLCHDLISPMGAIGNGLELLELSDMAGSPELELISDSLASALAKLRYYRLAFGPADVQARQSFDETRAHADAMFQNRFTVTWSAEVTDIPRPTVRLIFLALLCLERSLPMGAAARVAVTEREVTFLAEGRRAAPPAELWALVTDGAAPLQLKPDAVQFALLRQALVEADRRIEAMFTDTGAELRMTAPTPIPA